MRRLLERHGQKLIGFDLDVFEAEPDIARRTVGTFLAGSEETYPPGLIVDLHRIAELGDQTGLELLTQHARRMGIPLTAPQPGSVNRRDDPKHVALWAFLNQPELFESVANVISYFRKAGVAEFAGQETGVEAQVDEEALSAFEQAARRLFEADRFGDYCSVDWYEDGGEMTLVVSHGSHVTSTPIIEDRQERFIAYRGLTHAYLAYSSVDGRLKLDRRPDGQA